MRRVGEFFFVGIGVRACLILNAVVSDLKLFYPTVMNSHLKSFSQTSRILLVWSALGCAQKVSTPEAAVLRKDLDQKLSTEVSLKADRDYLEEARKELPVEIKKANDELAFDLAQLSTVKEHPSVVSSRFQEKVRKLHERYRQQSSKVRDDYNREERGRRDAFLKKSQQTREAFHRKRADRAETQGFYNELERQRRDFYAVERERRSEFDSEMRLRAKDFNDSVKERSDQFRSQLSEYRQRYQPSPSSSALRKEFEDMQKLPATKLSTQDSGDN